MRNVCRKYLLEIYVLHLTHIGVALCQKFVYYEKGFVDLIRNVMVIIVAKGPGDNFMRICVK